MWASITGWRDDTGKSSDVFAPVCKEPLRERGIIREPRNCSAPPQGERTREHGNERGEERKDETSHDRVSARAETIDRAPGRVRVKAKESAVDTLDAL